MLFSEKYRVFSTRNPPNEVIIIQDAKVELAKWGQDILCLLCSGVQSKECNISPLPPPGLLPGLKKPVG